MIKLSCKSWSYELESLKVSHLPASFGAKAIAVVSICF